MLRLQAGCELRIACWSARPKRSRSRTSMPEWPNWSEPLIPGKGTRTNDAGQNQEARPPATGGTSGNIQGVPSGRHTVGRTRRDLIQSPARKPGTSDYWRPTISRDPAARQLAFSGRLSEEWSRPKEVK